MYGERIARLLERDGKLTPAQTGEARRTQAFFGGDLSTHLVRLGLADEDAIGQALSRITGAPYVWGRDLRAPANDVLAAVSPDVLARHRACPFAREGSTLMVAFLNPRDGAAVRAVSAAVGHDVKPCVTSEYQLDIALERHFGIRAEARRGLRVPSERASGPRPVKAVPTGESNDREEADRAEPEVGLDGLPLDADPELDHPLFFGAREGSGAEHRPESLPPPSCEPTPAGHEDRTRANDPMEELSRTLARAGGRDEITEAVLDFGEAIAARTALFAVQRDEYRCIAGRGRGLPGEGVLRTVFPANAGSVFDLALGSGGYYFGPVAPTPANRDVFTVIGGHLPRMAMILPIAVKGRTVAFVYLDDDGGEWEAPDVAAVRRAAAKTGVALEILLLKKKLLED